MSYIKNNGFIIERADDLTVSEEETPLSIKMRDIWIKYSSKNIVLDNGQMVILEYDKQVEEKIFGFLYDMFVEFIESEKKFRECEKIKKEYINHENDSNKSGSYIKKVQDIIISMDRIYKYIWNISKILIDEMGKHTDFVNWQKKKLNISNEIYELWNLIYDIRNDISHPDELETTFFKRNGINSIAPTIIFKGKEYDLLDLSFASMRIILIFSNSIIAAAHLHSKYVKVFTDETRTKLYIP